MNSEKPVSEVFDNGRRGQPLLGCDCVQCFGYCIVDHVAEAREVSILAGHPDSRVNLKTFEIRAGRFEGVDIALGRVDAK